jgi:putative tributyrin esterase
MTFAQLHWFSGVLGRQTATWVLLPESGVPPFSTFYLLHGLSDDQSMWLRRTRLESHVGDRPLIVVMPDGGRGFYTDHHDGGPQWATHIGVELPGMIERTFPALPQRAGRFIGGLSMGGYGALRIALGWPERFASASSHSGAMLGPGRRNGVPPSREWDPVIGPAGWAGSANDLARLAEDARDRGVFPRLRIDCGTEDFLLDDNRAFHQSLVDAAVPHEYAEFSGSHDWSYWDLHVRDAIAFHCGG